MAFKVPLRLRVKVSMRGIAKVMRRPVYIGLAAVVTFVAMGIVVYLFNFGLLNFFLFQSGLPVFERLLLVLSPYKNVFQYLDDPLAASILGFGILAGVNTAMLVFVRRYSQAGGAKRGLAALLAGVVGAGCGACGTSILVPVLASLGATAGVGLVGAIGVMANLAGMVMMSFSIYRFGQIAAALPSEID
jgi:hypothetical protein